MRNGTFAYLCKAVAVAAVAALGATGPSFSAATSITVSGDSKLSECGAPKKASYALELTGSLAGCWATFVGHHNCQEMNGFALYTEIGREEFAGKLDGADVTFNTQYTFTGVYPAGTCPEPAAEKEIVGGCVHYISGDRLVGVMRFYDVMAGAGAPHYFYEGTLAKS
jgi:hypothetical protein